MPSIDGFRGLAVMWIVLGHCWNELGGKIPLDEGFLRSMFSSSYMGVDMLFIVSGFVLFLPAVQNGTLGDVRSYALRRAARIVPAFYVALVVSYVVSLILDARDIGLGGWLSHLLFLHGESHHHTYIGFGVNGALWTMSVEVIFYVTLPFVAGWYQRRPFLGLIVAVVGAEVWQLFTTKLPQLLDRGGVGWAGATQGQVRMALAFPTYAGHFAIGMTCAWLFVRLREQRTIVQPNAVLVQTAAFLGAVTVAYLRGWEGMRGASGPLDSWTKTADRMFFFAVLVLATALAPKVAQLPVANRVSRFLGTVSYGTYLFHLPLIKLLISALGPALGLEKGTTSSADLVVLIAIAAPLSVGIGYLSHTFIEEPVRRWARRAGRHQTAQPSGTPVLIGAGS